MSNIALGLYKYIDGVNDTPFPSEANQAFLTGWQYNAKRMGGAPSITGGNVIYHECLDNNWDENICVKYKGESYFAPHIPTSSYSSQSVMYEHKADFISERAVLDAVYFYDVVSQEDSGGKPVSNSSKFVFNGTLSEFIERVNASLSKSGVPYSVVLDSNQVNDDEAKFIKFENKYISEVLQEGFKIYGVPYYFIGRVCHYGFRDATSSVLDNVIFEYGKDKSLKSVSKSNANNKIINRITGFGSSENIPYYYPNSCEQGMAEVDELNSETITDIEVVDDELFARKITKDSILSYGLRSFDIDVPCFYINGKAYENGHGFKDSDFSEGELLHVAVPFEIKYGGNVNVNIDFRIEPVLASITNMSLSPAISGVSPEAGNNTIYVHTGYHNVPIGKYKLLFDVTLADIPSLVEVIFLVTRHDGWADLWKSSIDDIVFQNLSEIGISITGTPSLGDSFKQKIEKLIPYQKNLMPSIYRNSEGNERFYKAKNYPFAKPDGYVIDEASGEYELNGYIYNNNYVNAGGDYYDFQKPFKDGKPKEYIQDNQDIKPTIKGMVNAAGLPIDEVIKFAFDENDSDEIDEQGNFLHPYFFALLHKTDGQFGFNLFDQANDKGEMTLNFNSGRLGGCNFLIGVSEESQSNTVQIQLDSNLEPLLDADGHPILQRDENGDVLYGLQNKQPKQIPQSWQNDTRNNEVWVALKKDSTTFGEVMPNVANNYLPDDDDPQGNIFVILNITLPKAYKLAAEQALTNYLIATMSEQNSEHWNFNIDYSRVYMEEEPVIMAALDENKKIKIRYNGIIYERYVLSYSYKTFLNESLPSIVVDLAENLITSTNPIESAISQVTNLVEIQANAIIGYQQVARLARLALPSANVQNAGSESNPIYFDNNTAKKVRGISVPEDIHSDKNVTASGGMAARGIADLSLLGGSSDSTTAIKFDPNETYSEDRRYLPHSGLITLPAYPSIAGLASQTWVMLNFASKATEGRVSSIEALIPSQATSSNQLADKAFVNSSIATATATYQGSYNLVSDLSLSVSSYTRAQIAAALASEIVGEDNNDYAFVEIPTSDSTPAQIASVERYKYNGTAWEYEYTLNNSGMTAAQWAALNSGITSGKVSAYDAHLVNTSNPHNVTKAQVGLGNVENTALSTWAGSGYITTLGTIATGVWQGTAIGDTYISSASAWNAKYDLPSGGIPKTDLAQGVQDSLGKADTALQSHQTIYSLTIKKNGTQVGSTYNPATAAQTIDITDVASATALSGVSGRVGDLEGYFTSGVANNAARLSNTSAIGSTTKPVYFTANGVPAECSTYGGGTAVTLNNSSKAANTASFYAPTTAGTANQVLVSGGSGNAPTWTNQSNITAGALSTVSKTLFGNTYWTSGGVPTSIGTSSSPAALNYVTNIDSIAYFDRTNSRLGIGTDSPTEKLHVSGNALITGGLTVSGGVSRFGAAGQCDIYLKRNTIASGTPTNYIHIPSNARLQFDLHDENGASTYPILGLEQDRDVLVYNNLKANGGVAARGIADLAFYGGGGGSTGAIQFDPNKEYDIETVYTPVGGVISLPAYPTWQTLEDKPRLATVATSGSYNDLLNKPTISDATITVKQTGISDQTFTLNGSAATITLNDTTYNAGTKTLADTGTDTENRVWSASVLASWLSGKGYITGINSSMVTSALGYTPFDSASFTQANIQSTLGISNWALASSKPSYAFSEITGTVTNAQMASAGKFTIGSTNIELGTTYTQANFRSYLGLGGAATYDATSSVTQNSGSLVTSGGVYSYVNALLTAAMKVEGETTTPISDGSTTNPVTIGGQSVSAYKGMVVFYGSKEFVWVGSNWKELGDESSFALKTTTVSGTGYLTGGGALSANQTLDISQTAKGYIDTAYAHATDSSRVTSASNLGFYRFEVTAQGHIGSVTAVQASDLTTLIGNTTYAPYNSAGYLPLTGGTIDGQTQHPLILDNTGSGATTIYTKFNLGGTNVAQVGYYGNSAFLSNEVAGKDFRLFDNGNITYANNTIWHSGNDGSGSGLDADLLDGQHGSYYAAASALDGYLPIAQVSQEQYTNEYWVRSYALTHRQSFVYNTSGEEWAYWIGMRSSDTSYGTILRLSHYGRVQYMYKAGGGDNDNWSGWNDIITSMNIGSQSVIYATSAGSAMNNIEKLAWWNESDSHSVDNLVSGAVFAYTTHGAPTNGTIVSLTGTNNSYQTQIQGKYNGDALWFRNKNDDNNTWSNWRYVIHSGNIASQSVNYASSADYATSAGNADTVDNEHASAFAHVGQWNNLLTAGNEFNFISNGFTGDVYFNWQDGNRQSAANISGYYFCNGRSGYAPVYAGAFVHIGYISSAYVLTSDGGAAAISGLSVGSARNMLYTLLDTDDNLNDISNGLYYQQNYDRPANARSYNEAIIQIEGRRGYDYHQLSFSANEENIGYRLTSSAKQTWSDWKVIAFTDSNVASATILQNTRSLWGNNFNGSSDVGGEMTFTTLALATNYTDTWSDGVNSHPWYGYDHRYPNSGVYSTTISDYYGLSLKTGGGIIVFDDHGQVGIGIATPSYKLHVTGDIYAQGGWLRTSGSNGSANGWLSQDYGGGWYCDDYTYVKTYGNRSIYTASDILAGGDITASGGMAARGIADLSVYGGSDNVVTNIQISGSSTVYTPQQGKVTLPAYPTWATLANKPTFATVATTGSYNDLSNKPSFAKPMGSIPVSNVSSLDLVLQSDTPSYMILTCSSTSYLSVQLNWPSGELVSNIIHYLLIKNTTSSAMTITMPGNTHTVYAPSKTMTVAANSCMELSYVYDGSSLMITASQELVNVN